MTTREKRRKAALHEAGHAVLAIENGYQLHYAEIGERGGGVCAVEIPPRRSLEALEHELEYVVAGDLAVALDNDRNWRDIDLARLVEREAAVKGGLRERYGSYELATARLWGGTYYGRAWFQGVLPRIAEQSVGILSERWRDVDKLAYRLWHQGKVDFLENELLELETRSINAPALVNRIKRDARRRVATSPTQAEVDALARFSADENTDVCDRAYTRAKLAEWGYKRRAYHR